jgi:hypothetical protein
LAVTNSHTKQHAKYVVERPQRLPLRQLLEVPLNRDPSGIEWCKSRKCALREIDPVGSTARAEVSDGKIDMMPIIYDWMRF